MFFGTATSAWVDTYTGGGGLNVCAADGPYAVGSGLCYTISGFSDTQAEGGKVFISETSKAGGFTPGAEDSKLLSKACINNVVAV